MAEENIYKQELSIRELLTRSVTLYPTRAQVIRDVNDITLKPGANEITIYGLTPTADESSIKVDGKGLATITDTMVDLIPNRDVFEDMYPSDSEEEDKDDSEDNQGGSETESETIKALSKRQNELEESMKEASELGKSAASRLLILEKYGQSVERDRPSDLESCLRVYRKEREKVFEDHKGSDARIKMQQKELQKVLERLTKARHAAQKEKQKAAKEKTKQTEKKLRALKEKIQAKCRLREERAQFWPKKVYRITLSLDTNSELSPASSRRGSIDSLRKPSSESTSQDSCQISLSVSYITNSASWAPRYDLSVDTPSNSGLITYRAEYLNATSETWKDAKVILSTSHGSFQGLGEPIPVMLPWHIRLNKILDSDRDSTGGALYSRHEQESRHAGQMALNTKANDSRSALFGLDGVSISAPQRFQQMQQQGQPQNAAGEKLQDYQMQLMLLEQQNKRRLMMARQEQDRSAFGSSSNNAPAGYGSYATSFPEAPRPQRSNQYAGNDTDQTNMRVPVQGQNFDNNIEATQIENFNLQNLIDPTANENTIIPDLPSLATQESSWEKTGLTATYDIPGLRTIAPSYTIRRHKIASIRLKDVHLSHRIVPKLRAAAFLKAVFRNSSSITLLKGSAGLTLDGSFLGNTSIPRCSAGETFSISLGVDPSVNVAYSKPVVKRRQSGVFQKEGSGIYTRTCVVTNTKAKTVQGFVLDQIPVSEDERLKVEVLDPPGLRSEGDSVKSGSAIAMPSAGAKTVDQKWGKAAATLKKGGEVCWDFKIEPGRGIRLMLEYETRFPSSDVLVCV